MLSEIGVRHSCRASNLLSHTSGRVWPHSFLFGDNAKIEDGRCITLEQKAVTQLAYCFVPSPPSTTIMPIQEDGLSMAADFAACVK